MNWIEKIEESENINQLPLYSELQKIADEEGVELSHDVWDGEIIEIKDGTTIELENLQHSCFADRRNEYTFYHIVDTDIYVCADCGLKQRAYENFKKEVEFFEDELYEDILLLPLDWNERGIKAYLQKRVKKQEEYEQRAELRRLAKQEEYERLYATCWNCANMKNNECIYNMEDEECCDMWEAR